MSINNILHVGWWTKEYRMGGSILHVETLMELLADGGLRNSYFCGGRYNLFYPRPHIKKWKKDYVTVYELVNSPNLIWSFGNPAVHIKNKTIERLFLDILKTVRPDVVHFHELESLTGSLLTLTRELRIPYVIDVHNYWYLCPQRDLMDMNGKVCTDWKDGIKCASCKVLPRSTKAGWMFVGYIQPTILGSLLNKTVSWRYKNRIKKELEENIKTDTRNIPVYKERRNFFITELNKADAIIYPSKRSLKVYSTYGTGNHNGFILYPLNKNYLLIKPKKIILTHKYPITFGYLGSILPLKGLHILIEAFRILVKQVGDRCKLLIYGAGESVYIEGLKEKSKNLNISFKGKYSPENINDILEKIDIAIVPSLCEDCSPVVLNELRLSRTPIIGSRIGGIEEVINHGIDGYLVNPGDAQELALYMTKIVENPQIIKSFMKALNFSFDANVYVREIKNIYNLVCDKNAKNFL